jgi:hypothetical protein
MSDPRAPDWRTWKNIPTVTLYEAVALSLGIDPKKLRLNPKMQLFNAGKRYNEGAEFDARLFLVRRCLGESLPGPINFVDVHYNDSDPMVRLSSFVEWARSVRWELPAELQQVAGCTQNAEPRSGAADEYVPPKGLRTNKAEAAEKACRGWLIGLKERPATKDLAFSLAQAAVAGIGPLSRKAFERAWVETAPAVWKRAGRRKKPR